MVEVNVKEKKRREKTLINYTYDPSTGLAYWDKEMTQRLTCPYHKRTQMKHSITEDSLYCKSCNRGDKRADPL